MGRQKPRRTLLLIALLSLSVILVADEKEQTLHFAADRPLDCLHIRLELEVDVEGKHIDARAVIDLAALRDVSAIRLDAHELEISAVTLARSKEKPAPVAYQHDDERLEVVLGEPLATGDKATLIVDYAIDDPSNGLHFYGPSENEPDIPYVVWSQGQSIFNSYWFPCFDHPNERQTTELIVTTKSGYEVSSNGRLLSRRENPEGGTVTYHWLQDKPHVAYLVSLIAGPFQITRESWRGKSVEYWVHPELAEHAQRTFRNTTRMLDFFSDSIGMEYPWDRYAQICCEGFGGGMENTSATTLGSWSLHDERSLIDGDSDGLIAHELAHQWFGDLLTCADWAHLWLNEGFASYFEALWEEHDGGADEFAYNMVQKARSARRGGKARPIVDRAYDHPRSMFDSRAYPKGAWVLHMIRRRLGDETFWKVIGTFTREYAFASVETVDLRRVIEGLTGRGFGRFFYDWTERPGHPEVAVSYRWLSDDGLARIQVRQTQEAAAFHFPLDIEFRFGAEMAPLAMTRNVTEKEMTFYYPLPNAPAMVRIDPRQAVLMELKESKARDLWKEQLLEDPSVAARIRAAEHFGESKRDADRRLLAEALAMDPFWGVQAEAARALAKSGGEIARDALITGITHHEPRVRRACVSALDSFHRDPVVINAVRPLVVKGDPSYRVESAAIETYSRLEADDALALLKQAMERDSRFEIIRSAALNGLARIRSAEVIPLLEEWSGPDRSRHLRPAAVRALSSVTRRMHIDDSTYESIVGAISDRLGDSGSRVRSAAVRALGSLGEPVRARPTLAVLEGLAANDPSGYVRRAATRTIETIEKGKPAQIQLAELREDLREALELNKDLSERLKRIENRQTQKEGKPAKKAAAID